MLEASFVKRHNARRKEASRLHHNYSEEAKRRGIRLSKFDKAKFLAWDGEGLDKTIDDQVYALLANSNNDYIINVDGLGTEDCLDFLTSTEYDKDCIHVCFGASYDVNMMLRDVPEDVLRDLHKGDGFVKWGKYDLEYRPRKSFTVHRYKVEYRNGRMYRCYNHKKKEFIVERSITLWDVFGFFQKRFVAVLKEWTKGTQYEQKYASVIDDIEKGKERRGSFTVDELESFVVPYCLNEVEALRDIMHILHGYLEEAGLKLSRWDGAGAIAAAALKKFGVKKHIRTGVKLDEEPFPESVMLASEFAYFGGWIEAFMFGDIRWPIYHYDLRSAYPSGTVDLPSLTMGHWETIDSGNMLPVDEWLGEIQNFPSYWIAHIEWDKGPIYGPCPFSWRNKKGNVTRPVQGRGWQWSPEVEAAIKNFPNMEFKIDCIHYFVPDEDNEQPFAFVAEAYQLRALMKKLGKGVEKVYKLYLNSLYGKLAQSLGYNSERDLKPPYHCLVYAGIITSKTRAKILDAVMQSPLSIISVATDGIYSLAPLKLDVGQELGQWEYTHHESMTLVQPGFYWYETQGKESHYYRGFNEDCIKRNEVVQAYINNIDTLPVKIKRFITLGACMGLNNFKLWRKWKESDRMLDLTMQKSSKRVWKGETLPGNQQIKIARNRVYNPQIFIDNPDELESHKYEFDWDEDRDSFEGQSIRILIEDMFTMELCTDG